MSCVSYEARSNIFQIVILIFLSEKMSAHAIT